MPHKFEPTLKEIFILLSPPITNLTSVEVWIKASLVRAMLIITHRAGHECKGVTTYSAVSISVADSTVVRIFFGIEVCREVTMRIVSAIRKIFHKMDQRTY